MNFHNITYPDMNNGNGLRVVLWLSGCSHHCQGCQNPQTWNPNSGIEFDENAEKELFEELSKDYISGVTFSGGDPLFENNLEEVYRLCKKIKSEYSNKTIWIYTGYTWEQLFPKVITDDFNIERTLRQSIIELTDVLVDGRYEQDKRDVSYHWAGSTNQRIINIQETLDQNKIVLFKD